MRDPTVHECPECGSSVSRFAAACPECDTPNPARKGAIAGALAALVLTMAATLGIGALAWLWSSVDDQQQAGDDLAWLTAAMMACDEDAARAPSMLFFIVIPLQ